MSAYSHRRCTQRDGYIFYSRDGHMIWRTLESLKIDISTVCFEILALSYQWLTGGHCGGRHTARSQSLSSLNTNHLGIQQLCGVAEYSLLS
ncbi:hypothetical protein Tco_0093436 [Tanacetum coccineum]